VQKAKQNSTKNKIPTKILKTLNLGSATRPSCKASQLSRKCFRAIRNCFEVKVSTGKACSKELLYVSNNIFSSLVSCGKNIRQNTKNLREYSVSRDEHLKTWKNYSFALVVSLRAKITPGKTALF